MIFQNEKTPFQAIKTTSPKSRKIDIFPNGLTHDFGPKMAFFPSFFFQTIQSRKMSFMIFQNEKTPFQTIKTRSLKSRKMDIFSQDIFSRFFSKKWPFFQFFFQAIKARKVSFMIFQNEKMPSQAIKRRGSKSGKIDIFLKGLSHSFAPKLAIFPSFFLGDLVHENVFYDILRR